MSIDISDNLRNFFFSYDKKRRLSLYQALVEELVNIEIKTQDAENGDIQALTHRFKGVCRYLSFDLDSQADVIRTPQQLCQFVGNVHSQLVAIKDEI